MNQTPPRSTVKVRDVMTPRLHVIDGLASVSEAMDLMRQYRVSALVIDRRHDGDEYGIVVVHDIASKVIAPDRAPERTSVYEIMSKPVLTLDHEMDIRYAIRMLARFSLSRGLVVAEGKPVGIVTMRDMVFRYVAPCQAEAQSG